MPPLNYSKSLFCAVLSLVSPSDRKSCVSFYYSHDAGTYYYGASHPMKPHRFRLIHGLLTSYGVFRKLDVFRPHRSDFGEMTQFHSSDYIEFLRRVTPDNAKDHLHQLQRFNLGPYTDCPVFDGLYDYCQLYSGGSIDGAQRYVLSKQCKQQSTNQVQSERALA